MANENFIRSVKPRVGKDVRAALKAIRKAAALERCSVDPKHKDAMKLYLDSWVVSQLDVLIDYLEGDDSYSTKDAVKGMGRV